MREYNPFTKLVVLEIANNHFGDVEHGKRLIDSLDSKVGRTCSGFRYAIKLQFRDLDTIIRPGYKNKHIKRFLETRLSWDEFGALISHAKAAGFLIMVTPFDEVSVSMMNQYSIDYCKVASCSAQDWPLLNAVAGQNRPVVSSTGGLALSDMDELVSFFQHRGKDFALNHCMARYPHRVYESGLGMIAAMRRRFPCEIGWSGHELPDDTATVQMAYAMGARMFETHVALPTDKYPKNAYSRGPEELDFWLDALLLADAACSLPDNRPEEMRQLRELMRGAWVDGDKVSYQMPVLNGMKTAGEYSERAAHPIKRGIHQIKALLHEAGVILPPSFETEYSHHFGAEDFLSIGTTMIIVVNRDYAKKILVMLPGQWHPKHYHKRKEETFHVLYGDLTVWLDDREFSYSAGQTVLVQSGVWHSFTSKQGCVFEEISTTAYADDSVYADTRITANTERKTKVNNWGRWEIV